MPILQLLLCALIRVLFPCHHLDYSYSMLIRRTVMSVTLSFQTSCKHHVQVKFTQQSVPQFSFALPGVI